MDIPVKVIVHRDDEGKLWAEVPGLAGCLTEGDTLEELKANIREAIEGCFGATQDEVLRTGTLEPGEVMSF